LDNALADLTSAIDRDPDNERALAVRGRVHRMMGRYDNAHTDPRASLQAEPSSLAHYQLGIYLTLIDEGDKASFHFQQAIEMERSELAEYAERHRGSHLAIALCPLAAGQRDAARASVREARHRRIETGQLELYLFDLNDLRDALGINIADIVVSIERDRHSRDCPAR
jgi:tetratricopeptide (TPR) repeat protein